VQDIYAGIPGNNNYKSEVMIFPNPFSDVATLILDDSFTDNSHTVRLMNIWGQQVRHSTMIGRTLTISRAGLPAGIYFFEVAGKTGKKAVGKIVIQ
jgi:hypothetical protein